MKLKFGAIITDGRGKVGGQVVSKNKAGAYLKNKVTPANPNTAYQIAKRANVTAISQAWAGLTDAQRSAWKAAVASYSKTDIFGDVKNPSGFNLFMWLNLNLLNVGSAQITSPPASSAVTSLTAVSVSTLEGGTFDMSFAPTPVPADHALVVLASGSMSPGRSYSKSYMRQIAVLPHTATISPADIFDAYSAKFGAPIVGKRIFVSAFLVNTTTGAASALLSDSGIVSA